MKLKQIGLHNFGWYQDAVIDLTGIRGAVIRGLNGTGKSTGFIDGPLAALFGCCRGNLDELMYPGADEMGLWVVFELNGQDYRVMRKRSLKTKAGKSELELHVTNGQEWIPISGARIPQTQQKIIELLGADYELFTSTCFFLQGEIDQFTKAIASKRISTLTEILRLDQYRPLRLSAMRHITITEVQHAEKSGQLTVLEQEASTVSCLESRQTEISLALVESNGVITQLEHQQQATTKEMATVCAALDQLETLPAQISELTSQHDNIRSSKDTMMQRRERAASLLRQREAIENTVKQEKVAKALQETLTLQLAQLSVDAATVKQSFTGEQQQLAAMPAQWAEIQSQQEAVRNQMESLNARRIRAAKILSERATIEGKVKEEAQARIQESCLEEERKQLAEQASSLVKALSDVRFNLSEGITLERRVANAQAEVDRQVQMYVQETARLDMALTADKESVEFLRSVPCGADLQRKCPFTVQAVQIQEEMPATEQVFQARFTSKQEQSIAPESCEYRGAAVQVFQQWEQHGYANQAKNLESRIQDVSAKQDDCETRRAMNRDRMSALARFTVLVPELAAAEREVESLDVDLLQREKEMSHWTRELEQMKRRENDMNLSLAQVGARLIDLDFEITKCEAEKHSNQVTIDELSKMTVLVSELAAAEREVVQVDEDLARFSHDLTRISQELTRLYARQDECATLTATHDRLSAQWQQDNDYLTRLRNDSHTAMGRLKEIELEIKSARDAARQVHDLNLECAMLLRDKQHFQALESAYAQIPILILEAAIPLLEEEANRILNKISNTGMRVRFDTQKALKSREGLMETLEIIVRDFRGERRYELYSGAEKFKVDLAVRIGLSRLLASRSGARLETIVIDEGFGCLDPDGIIQLRESLSLLAEDFGLLLVITHVEALKDTFPSQLLVTSDGNGSHVEVVR